MLAVVYIFCLKVSAWATPQLQPKWKNRLTNLTEKTTLVTNFADVAFGIGENYSRLCGAREF